jgi:predicted RNase H-like nuclease (RuvC/YqgF family)
MYASHYVIEKILSKWDNLEELKEEFGKFSQRYSQDGEFRRIYQEFKETLKKEPKELGKVKRELESLRNTRKMDSSGGTRDLPYSNRRHLSDEYGKA